MQIREDYIEESVYAFMQDTEEIIKYREALSPELKEDYHDEILSRGRKFAGLGFICGYDIEGNLWTSEKADLIYI